MKKILLTAFTLATFYIVNAQDATVKNLQNEANKSIKKDAAADTSKKHWTKGGLLSFNIAQGSLSNWAAGGDKFSLSGNLYVNGHAFYKNGKNSWDNNLDLYLGYINTTSLGTRKNDDRIDFLSKYGYALNPKLNIATLFNFRSQFFKGYDYSVTPNKVISNAMAPAYVLLSLGLDYKPNNDLSIFFSPLTSRWVIVSDTSLGAKYGLPYGKKSVNELGAYASINYAKALNKQVTYKGRLDLFSNYKKNPQNVDIYMTNMFSAKLSKVLSATWSLDIIYDDDVKLFGANNNSPATQLKSLVGVGLLVKM